MAITGFDLCPLQIKRKKEYYLEITNGPNMNSTFQSQLFKYQIIQIIWSNSGVVDD